MANNPSSIAELFFLESFKVREATTAGKSLAIGLRLDSNLNMRTLKFCKIKGL